MAIGEDLFFFIPRFFSLCPDLSPSRTDIKEEENTVARQTFQTVNVKVQRTRRICAACSDIARGLKGYLAHQTINRISYLFFKIFGSTSTLHAETIKPDPVLLDNLINAIERRSVNKWRQHIPATIDQVKEIENGGQSRTLDDLARLLKNCSIAYEKLNITNAEKKERELKEKINAILRKLREENQSVSCNKVMRGVCKAFESAVQEKFGFSSGRKKKFKKYLAEERGITCPEILASTVVIDDISFTEKLTTGDTKIGTQFLKKMQNGFDFNHNEFGEQIEYSEKVAGNGHRGFKPSELKGSKRGKGTSTNLRRHAVHADDETILYCELRSGVFSTYDKRGLSYLKDFRKRVNAALEKAKKNGKESTRLHALDKEICVRETLLIAQALPKILMAVEEMANNQTSLEMVKKTGSFLYTEQGYLSHLDKKEKAMLEDMYEVFKILGKKLRIKFEGEGENRVEVSGKGIITLILPLNDKVEKIFQPEDECTLTCPLFTQGINEWQSIGHLLSHDSLQDEINVDGLNQLAGYYAKAGMEFSEEFKKHFSPRYKRSAKDVEGTILIREATIVAGGVHGTHCKSGKDRTAVSICRGIAKTLKKDQSVGQDVSEDGIFSDFSGRVSLEVTAQNTGGETKYAFNPFQTPTLPEFFRPPARYRGAGQS